MAKTFPGFQEGYPAMKITAVLMLKAPRPGTVKTRLAKDIGSKPAADIYRSLVEHQIRQIPAGWRIAFYFAPNDAMAEMKDWLLPYAPEASFVPQCGGDLGARMLAAVTGEMAAGQEAVALIGGDCPHLSRAYLEEARFLCREADVVIGPSPDGGYVLLLQKKPHPRLFEKIAWSSPSVFSSTMASAQSLALKVRTMEPLEDIDDLESWRRFRRWNPSF